MQKGSRCRTENEQRESAQKCAHKKAQMSQKIAHKKAAIPNRQAGTTAKGQTHNSAANPAQGHYNSPPDTLQEAAGSGERKNFDDDQRTAKA